MNPNHDYFPILIPTKRYIKKYLQSIYGKGHAKEIVINTSHYFGMAILGFLDRTYYAREKKELVHQKFDVFDANLTLKAPKWWLTQKKFGSDLTKQNIIYINKLFEERFEEDMSKFCALYHTVGVERKDALEEFCKLHDIEIDVDITMEAITKKEYRYRQGAIKEFLDKLSAPKEVQSQQLSLYSLF